MIFVKNVILLILSGNLTDLAQRMKKPGTGRALHLLVESKSQFEIHWSI
jgi:hypothetical protein